MNRTRDLAWAAWLGGTAISFAVLETLALRRYLPTLSVTLQRWLGVKSRSGLVGPLLFAAFWTWVTVHVVRHKPMPPI